MELLTNKWTISLILSFVCVGLLEYIKYLFEKNLSKEKYWFIKDHIMPFMPILIGIGASFIKPIDESKIFSILYYIVSIHLIFKIFFKIIIDRIKEFIRNFKK